MKTVHAEQNAILAKLMDDLARTRNEFFPVKNGALGAGGESTELIRVDAAMLDALIVITGVLFNGKDVQDEKVAEWAERIAETLRVLRIAAQVSREYSDVLRAARYVGRHIGSATTMPSKVRYKRACAYLEKAGKRMK